MQPEPQPSRSRLSIFRNWLSLAGLVVVAGSLFSFLFLCALDVLAPTSNPYLGILAYLVAPGFLVLGIFLIGVGLILERRHLKREGGVSPPFLMVDLSRPRDRRNLIVFAAGSSVFLLISA